MDTGILNISDGVAVQSAHVVVDKFSKNMADATTTTAYTNVGFKPVAVLFMFGVPNSTTASWGMCDTDTDICFFDTRPNTGVWGDGNGGCMQAYTGTSPDRQYAILSSLDPDGFTLNWTKNGTVSGLANVFYMAYR